MKNAIFKASWQSLEDEREHLLAAKPLDEGKLLANLEAAKALLPWSPWKWAKKAYAMSKAWDTPLDLPGSYVYLVLSRATGKTYVGITGLIKLRKIIQRFKEHLFCARALRKLAKFGKRVRHPLYQSMSQMGLHKWIILPMAVSPQNKLRMNEQVWIKDMGKVFNVQKRFGQANKWRDLAGSLQDLRCTDAKELRARARKVVSNVREPRTTKTLLHLLVESKPYLDKELFAKLFCKVQIKVWQRHKIKLPAQLAFPYPLTNECNLASLRDKLKIGLQAFGLPKSILEYLLHVTRFVGKRGPSVAHILGTKTLKQKWATLERLGRARCTCAVEHTLEGVPKVDGCAVVRSGPDLIRVFGEDAALLRQNAQNCTFADRDELVETFEKAVARIGRLVPGGAL